MNAPAQLLIVDTETSGVDPAKDHLVEVAGVLLDVALGVPICARSEIVRGPGNEAEHINRVPEHLVRYGPALEREQVPAFFDGFERSSEPPIYLAHNASFDRSFLPGIGQRWICSYEDASWPRMPGETGSLTAIALAYDVGVVRAHRALEDCLTLAAVLGRVHELEGGLGGWLDRALEPKREVIALVSYADREKAKDVGFRWDGDRKVWTRKVRVSQLESYRASLSFGTRLGG